MKTCRKCKEVKPFDQYERLASGHLSKYCNACPPKYRQGTRNCTGCGELRPSSDFKEYVGKKGRAAKASCCYLTKEESYLIRSTPRTKDSKVHAPKACTRCGSMFTPKRANHKYCCVKKYSKKVVAYEPTSCERCGNMFTPKRANHINCCKKNYYIPKPKRIAVDPEYVYKQPKKFIPSVPTYKPFITCTGCWGTKKAELFNEGTVCPGCKKIIEGED